MPEARTRQWRFLPTKSPRCSPSARKHLQRDRHRAAIQVNAIQVNAIQDNAIQDNAIQDNVIHVNVIHVNAIHVNIMMVPAPAAGAIPSLLVFRV